MNNSKKTYDVECLIAGQWDRNAQSRFDELNSGKDKTYTNVLCPTLFKLLQKMSMGKAVLDIGCGLGFFSNYLHKNGFEVTGIDMSYRSILFAKNKFPHLNLFAESITDFSKGKQQQFDACIANMLIHNVPNIKEVAESVFEVLAPNGILIGCIPHPELWFEKRKSKAKRLTILSEAAYLMPFQIRGSNVHPVPFTYFDRTCDNYWKIFSDAGFSEIEAGYFEGLSGIPDDLVFFVAKKR